MPTDPSTASAPMLRLDAVRKSYRDAGTERLVLRDVSWTVDKGTFVAVTGPSGAGKSTLLHLVGGLDRPDAGTIEVAGRALGAMDDVALASFRATRVGFIFQSFNLVPTLSALDNVKLPGWFGAGIDDARAMESLARVGLADKAHRRPGELSGGERQRVAIARAACGRPSLVLADEPTGNLDSATGASIIELLSELHRAGTTLVVVTHEDRVSSAAQRVCVLSDGVLSEARTGGAS